MASASATLRCQCASSVEEALALSSSEDFANGFNLPAEHRHLLSRAHEQAAAQLRSNALAEVDQISREHDVDQALERLDAMKSEQPLLPDGSRCIVAAPQEAASLIHDAAAPVKRRHLHALRHALQQVDQENAELQRQYAEQLGVLCGASEEIASLQASFAQTAEFCESWRSSCA